MVSKMQVLLSHAANPDLQNRGGYWQDQQEHRNSGRPSWIDVDNFQQASEVCRHYIERNGLGGGNWTGGRVRIGRRIVARVSYNGRVWNLDDKEIVL